MFSDRQVQMQLRFFIAHSQLIRKVIAGPGAKKEAASHINDTTGVTSGGKKSLI